MASSSLHQPILREPLQAASEDQAYSHGVVGVRSRVKMWLAPAVGRPEPVRFVVDSGASYSLISLDLAAGHGLPVPPAEAEMAVSLQMAGGPATARVRPGRIRGWWTEKCIGYPFDWPVLFRVGGPSRVPPILGLGGVIHTCRWTFDGTYSLDAPYGSLMLEDIR